MTAIKTGHVQAEVQGVLETWFGAMAEPVGGQEYKVLHLLPPTGTKPGVLFLEMRPRENASDVPVQRFMVEISVTSVL